MGGDVTGRWPLSVGGRLVIDGEPTRFVLTRVEHEQAETCNEKRRSGRCCWTPAR